MSLKREPETIPISLVAHHVFCPRRAWLESVGEQVDSYAITVGKNAHRRVDQPAESTGKLRGVSVEDLDLGVSGRCDVIQRAPDGSLEVIEFKATPVRKKPVVTEPQRIQLALQGLALEARGYSVSGYRVRFTSHNVEKEVDVSDDDKIAALAAVAKTRQTVNATSAPPPLEDDPKCLKCSHAGICLPEERRLETVRHRVNVPDPDTEVLHLASPGSRASLRRGRIIVSRHDEDPVSIPVERVQSIIIHGNSDLSSALIREALWRSVPIIWCSGTGHIIGWASSAASPNGHPRARQHQAAAAGRLDIARAIVEAKISNQATLLRRNGDSQTSVRRLRRARMKAGSADCLETLLGIEGEAASTYFGSFSTMLKANWATLDRRAGRGATDPVNVALNIAYGVLVAECIKAVVACGLDPHAGFLHSSGRNKPALALDLCEEFRPVIADSAVIRAFNNGELQVADFTEKLGDTRIRDRGRRALIASMQSRLNSMFKHPTFGYRITWRRAIEVQARLLLGAIDGTQTTYKGVTTR